jgi:hypothetical protein
VQGYNLTPEEREAAASDLRYDYVDSVHTVILQVSYFLFDSLFEVVLIFFSPIIVSLVNRSNLSLNSVGMSP